MKYRFALPFALTVLSAPLAAKDSLGVFGDWGAFRDPGQRCYAISMAESGGGSRDYQPFASVGTWPNRQVRGQFHVRLSRVIGEGSAITLHVGRQDFTLTGGGGDAWAQDKAMDAAIVAAMRVASRMTVTSRGNDGRAFTDSYSLSGVVNALDAATVGCSGRG